MGHLKDRLACLEREAGEQLRTVQCGECRGWPPVCWATVDTDGTETWKTEPPRACAQCGWIADLVVFHVVDDWRGVTPRSRRR
jgi:hypothetical protein